MSTQYIDAVLRLTDKFTAPMNAALGKLSNSQKTLSALGRATQKAGKTISSVGSAITTGITAPVAAFGAVAVNEFGNVDKELRLVQQTMGSTDEEANSLRKTMQAAAADSVFGMQDAADATLNFARAGYQAAEVEKMLAPSLDLAAGTATDLSVVTEGLGSTLKAFGADAKEASGYADVFAKAQAQANTTVEDLFGAMKTGGASFKNVGWDMKDLSVATGVLGDAMISGSEAGNAFKSGLANLANPEKTKILQNLGVDIWNTDGTMKSFIETQSQLNTAFGKLTDKERIAAATSLFGKNQMAKWLTLIQRSPADIQRMSDSLNGIAGTSKKQADALMSGVGGSIEKLKSSFDVLKNDLGGILGDIVKPVIDKVTEMMNAFRELPDETKKNIVSMVLKIAALGPALLIFGKLVTGIGTVISTVGKLGRAFKAAGSIVGLITSPMGIVVGVLAGVALATVLIIKNWDKVKATAQKVWGFVSSIVSNMGFNFTYISEGFNNLVGSIKGGIARIKEWLQLPTVKAALDFFTGVFVAKIAVAIGMISGIIGAAAQMIMDVVGGIMTVFSGIIDFIVGVFTGDWQRAWDGVSKVFEGFAEALAGIFKAPINAIIGMINGVVGAINGMGFDVPDWVPVIGGKKFALNIPTIPMLAKGTSYWAGGLAQINERGGEIVDLPSGTRVYPHDESVRMARRSGMQITIAKIADEVVIREDSDIQKLAAALALEFEKKIYDYAPA